MKNNKIILITGAILILLISTVMMASAGTNDTAVVTPNAVNQYTVRAYNFNITNNNTNSTNTTINNLSITIPSGFSFSGNISDVVVASGTVTTTTTTINVTNINILNGSTTAWVNVSNLNATGSTTQTFIVNVFNATQGIWMPIASQPTVAIVTGYGGAPTNLSVQFYYGNWTIGQGAVNITVQSQDTNGNLTNATSSVFLKITSPNQQYANLLPNGGINGGIVQLVNGTNSSATINVTNSAQAGIYTVTAYDLNDTAIPMTTASDNITYAAGTPGAATQYTVTANTTSQEVGKYVMLNITFKDANGQTTSNIEDYYLSIASNLSSAKIYSIANSTSGLPDQSTSTRQISSLLNSATGVFNATIKSDVVGSYNITIAVTTSGGLTHYYGSPQYIQITYTTSALSGVNITSPANNYSLQVVGSSVAIYAQALTGGITPLQQANLRTDFNLSGNATTVPSGWQNGSFSAYSLFPIQASNATHAWVYTNSSGIAVIYLNVSTYENAIHNVTVSMSNTLTSWNNTINSSTNATAINATRSKILLTSNVTTAQVSGEADPSYNWMNLTATLKDQYNNTVEDAGIIITFSDNNTNAGYGIFNASTATTDSNGNAIVLYRSAKAGTFNVTATNATLSVPSNSTIVRFYGIPATVKAAATSVSTNTSTNSINITVSVLDSDGNVYERLGDLSGSQKFVNVSVNTSYSRSSAGIFNGSGVATDGVTEFSTNLSSGKNQTVNITLTNGKGYILINDTTAESVTVQVWSTGLQAVYPNLTSSNATITFTSGTGASLNVSNVTASSVKYGNTITLMVEAKDANGNRNTSSQADLMPVKLQFNSTYVSVSGSTLVTNSTGVNETGYPYIQGYLTSGAANVTITASNAVSVRATTSTTVSGISSNSTDVSFTSHNWTNIKVETNRLVVFMNGSDPAIITVSLRDENNNIDTAPNTSDSITVAKIGGTATLNQSTLPLSWFTGTGYVNNISLTATAGPVTVYAYNSTITSTTNATVNVAGYPAKYTVTPSASSVSTGSSVNLTVNLTDINGTPVSFASDFNITVTNVTGQATLSNGSATSGYVIGNTTNLTGGNSSIWLTGVSVGTVKISVNSSSFGTLIESVNVTTITVTSSNYTPYSNTTRNLTLYSGWNFISVPKRLNASYNTFGELGISFDAASYAYNASTGSFVALNSGSALNPLEAYWVHVASQGSYTLVYSTTLDTPPSKQLFAGWNAVGVTSESATPANQTLQSVTDKWSTVIGWNAVNQTYQTTLIKGVTTGDHSEGTSMNPGQGYWAWMTADGKIAAISG